MPCALTAQGEPCSAARLAERLQGRLGLLQRCTCRSEGGRPQSALSMPYLRTGKGKDAADIYYEVRGELPKACGGCADPPLDPFPARRSQSTPLHSL